MFNQGLLIEELFVNTPKKIVDRKWTWFIKNYGSTGSKEDAISDVFKYTLFLIFNKMIDDKMRFKFPVGLGSYWDFETIQEDEFIEHRQNGRFQNIDFIESDFTGYAAKYCYMSKKMQKTCKIYFGGDLKKKFIENINSGHKYYTTKDFVIEDILDKVYERFIELTKEEVKRIVVHGFRRMHSAKLFGCEFMLNTKKFGNCFVYIGSVQLNPARYSMNYNFVKDKKLRKIYSWQRPEFDGNYYIGLNKATFEKWLQLNKVSRTLMKFEMVVARKIMEEFYYKHEDVFIFKINVKKYKGMSFWIKKKSIRNAEYMGKAHKFVFTPTNMTWLELIKEYETRNK